MQLIREGLGTHALGDFTISNRVKEIRAQILKRMKKMGMLQEGISQATKGNLISIVITVK